MKEHPSKRYGHHETVEVGGRTLPRNHVPLDQMYPPLFMIADVTPVRMIARRGKTVLERWDWSKRHFVEDFDYVYAALSGRDPHDDREFASDNYVLSEEEFVDELRRIALSQL